MLKHHRSKKLIALVIMFLFMAVGPLAAAPKFFTIASGPVGGGWYILGGVLGELVKSEYPETKVAVRTGGAISNPTTVSTGKADVATTQDQIFYQAYNNYPSFKEHGDHSNLMGLAYLGDIYMGVFLVKQDSEFQSLQQIADNKMPIRIVTAPKGSSPSKATERLLEEYGISTEDLKEWGGSISYVSYSEGSALIKDGHADAWCGPIMPATIDLAVSRPLKVLPISEKVRTALNEKYKYGIRTIPKGTYDFITEDTPVIAESPILIVNKDMPEDVAYTLVKVMCNNPDKIRGTSKTYSKWSPEVAPNITGGPIHPGAVKYYKEKGLMQ